MVAFKDRKKAHGFLGDVARESIELAKKHAEDALSSLEN